MGRRASSWYCKRSNAYFVRLGERSETTGKLKAIALKDEHGNKIVRGDEAGRARAMARILTEREEVERRRHGPTVGDLSLAYLRWHKAVGSKPKTLETHLYHLTLFGDFAGDGIPYRDRAASSVTVGDLARYRRHMEARGNQTGYIRLAYLSILACWRWGARPVEDRDPLRMLEINPFDGLARPKKGRGRRLVLPWPVIKDLLRFADEWAERPTDPSWHKNRRIALERYRPLTRLRVLALRLIAECGSRPHEAMELRWDWVQESERVILIPREFTKTGKEDRIIGLSLEMADSMGRLRALPKHPIYVFATPEDPRTADEPPRVNQYDDWFRELREAAQKSGVAIPKEATPYTLRHSFVSQARAGGIDLRELAPAMGHSAQVSESTYAHAQLGEIRELMDRARIAREKSG